MTFFDTSTPVIVGGIAGMTLCMTGVKSMFDLGQHEFIIKNKLDPVLFTPESPAAWTRVIHNTLILVICFFISEICILIHFLTGDCQTPWLISLGYLALISTLGLMIFIYYVTVRDFQKRPKKIEKLDSMKEYPEPHPLPPSPP